MTVQLDFIGASGAVYRYFERDGDRLSPSGGNFIFASESPDGLTVIYVGEVENLMTLADARWPEAKSNYGATHAFVRLNVTASVRRREREDLIAAYHPPMNAAAQDGPAAEG
jgi:hypothetical protein